MPGPSGSIEMVVFNGATPRLSTALNLAREEALLWSIAGAKGLSLHTARDDG